MNTMTVQAPATTGPNHFEDIKDFRDSEPILAARRWLTGNAKPSAYYSAAARTLPTLFNTVEAKTARELLEAIEIKYIQHVQALFDASNTARKDGDTKATKPADLYRKFSKDLRTIWKRGGQTATAAHGLLQDITLEQTQSFGDLETPDYIDGYTKEKIYEAETVGDYIDMIVTDNPIGGVDLLLKALAFEEKGDDFDGVAPILPVSNAHKELLAQAERCRQDLGWGDEQVTEFLKANMDGFDAESDDDPELYDESDPHTPDTLLERELVMNRELYFSARQDIVAFNQARAEIFETLKLAKIKSKQWLSEFRLMLDVCEAKDVLVSTIERVAKEDAVTAGVIYMSVAGTYGLTPDHIKGIRGWHNDVVGKSAISVNLVDFVEEWEDDLLNLQQDSISRGSPMSESRIDEYAAATMQDVAGTMPEYDHNPVMTASWNNGFARAVMGGGTWPEAETAAWAAWREAMDPKAAEAYIKVLAETESRKAAMAAFWKACKKGVPRPQEAIKAVRLNGLILASGRVIDWRIARMKIQGEELDLSGDIKPRLLKKLQELNVGQAIWPLLQ